MAAGGGFHWGTSVVGMLLLTATASAFAQDLGQNGHQSDWIVLEYEGAANDTDPAKATYAGIMDST